MQKLIKNQWCRDQKEPISRAKILSNEIHPEGLDVERIRFLDTGRFIPNPNTGHIISILKGSGQLYLEFNNGQLFNLKAGVHIYLPPGLVSTLEADSGFELLHVASASSSQARGKQMLIRDEMFLAACASMGQSLRWILTPQYLSRRIFLHHDQTLLSKSGNPISWFRTTMFDVEGLPRNEDGESVFKMSYNSRTEFNVCYDVKGTARVRMAQHPYKATKQVWDPWLAIDSDSTYHLNESAGGPEEECYFDDATSSWQFLRNKHEVYINDGYVTLFCLFDPAPAGIERHRPGEYTDYEPLSQILQTKLFKTYMEQIEKYDEMLDYLSFSRAKGELRTFEGTPVWKLYLEGRDAQIAIETELANTLIAEGSGREKVIANWMEHITD